MTTRIVIESHKALGLVTLNAELVSLSDKENM